MTVMHVYSRQIRRGLHVLIRFTYINENFNKMEIFQLYHFFSLKVPNDTWNFTKNGEEDIVGHVVMAGPRYYKLCPVEIREEWLRAYEHSDFKCLT